MKQNARLHTANALDGQVDTLQSKLASFAESDEVKSLLMQMLKDLDQRQGVIAKAYEDTKAELASHTEQLVKYEKQVVDLSNAADKAKQLADNADLERQKLNGESTSAKESYTTEHAEFVIVSPPSVRAIYIIKTIMAKVEAFCSSSAAATTA